MASAIVKFRRGTSIPSLTISEPWWDENIETLRIGTSESGSTYITLAKVNDSNIGSLSLTGDLTASNAQFGGSVDITGDIIIGGTIILGDDPADTIVVSAEFSGSIVPDTGSAYNIGSPSKTWDTIYVDNVVSNNITASAVEYSNILNLPTLVSGSSQIDHNSTTNWVSNEHIDHAGVSIIAGDGMSGGGNITTSRTLSLNTGSQHFIDGVSALADPIPSGTVSGSDQVTASLDTRYLQNVVEDTTPQLGGDLDINSNSISGSGTIDINGFVRGTSLYAYAPDAGPSAYFGRTDNAIYWNVSHAGDDFRLSTADANQNVLLGVDISNQKTGNKVGIGVGNPQEMLHVSGNVYITGAGDASTSAFRIQQGPPTPVQATMSHIAIYNTGSQLTYRIWSDSNNHTNKADYINGTLRNFYSTFYPMAFHPQGYSSRGGLLLGGTSYETNYWGLRVIEGGSSGSLNVADTLYVTSSRVGIGTNTPASPLSVEGDVRTTTQYIISNGGNITKSGTDLVINGVADLVLQSNSGNESLRIDTSGAISSSYAITASAFTLEGTGQNLLLDDGTTVATSSIQTLLPDGVVSGSSQLTSSYDLRYELQGSGIASGSSQFTSSYDTRYVLDSNYQVDSASFDSRIALATSGGLTQILEDTTPQLGGDLDLNGSDITGNGNITFNGFISASGAVTASAFTLEGTGENLLLDNGLTVATSSIQTAVPSGTVSGSDQVTASLDGRYLQNVVEDTTPELGGNLVLGGNNITGEGSITISGSSETITFTDVITISGNANPNFSSVEINNRLAVATPAYGGSRIGDAYLQTPSLDIGYNPAYTDSGAINFKSGSQQTIAGMFTNTDGTVFTIKGFDDSIMVVDHTSIDAVSGSEPAESTLANTISFTNGWSYINDQGVQIYPAATTPVAETHFQILQNRGGAPRMGFYAAFYTGAGDYDRIYSITPGGSFEFEHGFHVTGSVTASAFTVGGTGTNFLLDDGNTVATSSYLGGGGLANIVEDTTPQLGGNLDLNGNNISGSTGNIDIAGTVSGSIIYTDDIFVQTGGQITTRAGQENRLTFYPSASDTTNFFELLNDDTSGDFVFELQAGTGESAIFRAYDTPLQIETSTAFITPTPRAITFAGNQRVLLTLESGSTYESQFASSVFVTGSVSASAFVVGGIGENVLLDDGTLASTASIGAGGGLANIVEDTTPQLGGNLDTNGFSIGSALTDSHVISGSLTLRVSGSTVFDILGSQGQLFSITDDLTGDIFSVGDISGDSILNVNSSGVVTINERLDLTGSLYISGGIGQNVLLDNGTLVATSSLGGGISDIVTDTTPQLGGTLDMNGNDISGSGIISASAYYKAGGDGTSVLLDNGTTALTSSLLASGSGISSIVQDTTPQLGGALDTNGFPIGSAFTDTHVISGSVIIEASGSTVFEIQGSQGQLFAITDDLTGDIFAVGDISGDPIFNVNASGIVAISDKLEVTGSIEATGEITAFASSDERLKLNMTPIENPLEKLSMISGYSYDWDETKQKDYSGNDIGVSAQEIQKVLPQLVKEKRSGYLGVKYDKIVALLIESNKALLKRVEDLERRLNEK